ncbi:MAG: T9SS type A sorting domain-containing protein [Flavobacteriaceae bacterium]|nr:T9SS type A sorting domain-containing protein [Flavobacteriaceae bacterium]
MKNLLLVLLTICSLQCIAQDPQLLETTWYLDHIIIDSNQEFPPSEEGEAEIIPMDIALDSFNTVVCDSHSCNGIDFNGGNDSFTISSCITGIFGCDFTENGLFQLLYFDDFFNINFPPNTFDYTFDVAGDTKTLTLTNSSGHQAVYNNMILGIKNPEIQVGLYPNPVVDIVHIRAPNNEILSIQVFTLEGKEMAHIENGSPDLNQISMAGFDTGIYFLRILTNTSLIIRKIVKK